MLGGALLGVVGGVLADRFDRQMVLKASFLIRALLLVVAWLVSPVAAVVALTVWVIGEQPTLAVAAALFVAAICIHLTLSSLDHGVDSRRQEHHESSWLELASGMAVVTTTPFVRRLVLYWFLSMATVSMAMASAAVWFRTRWPPPTTGTAYRYPRTASAQLPPRSCSAGNTSRCRCRRSCSWRRRRMRRRVPSA